MNSDQINLLQSKLLNQLQKDNPLSSPSVNCRIPKVTIAKNAVFPKEIELALKAVEINIIEQETHGMNFSCLLELTNETGFCVNLKVHSTKLPDISKTSIRGLTLSALSGEIIMQGNYSNDKNLTRLTIENTINNNTLPYLPKLPFLNSLTIHSNTKFNLDFSKLIGFKELSHLVLYSTFNRNYKYNLSLSNISPLIKRFEKINIVNNAVSAQDICQLAPLTKQIEISQMDVDFKEFGDIFQKNITWKFSACNLKNEQIALNFENIFIHKGRYKEKEWISLKQFICEGCVQEKIGDTYRIFGPGTI